MPDGIVDVSAVPDALAPPPVDEADGFGKVEAFGIDYIPPQYRHGTPRELFWPWFAANSTFINMIAGGVVMLDGLSLVQGLLVVLVGNLFFVLVGVCSLPGPRAGTATLAISRAAFGLRGNLLPNIFSWFATLGWETINIIIGTLAARTLLAQLGLQTPHWSLILFLIGMAFLTFIVPVLGHATLVVVQKWMSLVLTAFTVVMAALLLPKVHWGYTGGHLAAHGIVATWLLALVAILGAGAVSWFNFASDYSRYLPKNVAQKPIVWWVSLATFLPGVLFGGLGVVVGTLTDTSNPVGNLPRVLPTWFLVPFLLVVIAGVIANNVMNSYSSGLNLLALGARIPRWKSVMVDAVITVSAAAIALFVYDFSTVFTEFLSVLVILIAPWAAIYLVDFFRRRGEYHSAALLQGRGGPYWYRGGVRWPAVIALLIGVGAGCLTANTSLFVGPVSSGLLGGADISVMVGAVVAGAVFWPWSRPEVPFESEAVPAAPEPTNEMIEEIA